MTLKCKRFDDIGKEGFLGSSKLIKSAEDDLTEFVNKNRVRVISITTGGNNFVHWHYLFYEENKDALKEGKK